VAARRIKTKNLPPQNNKYSANNNQSYEKPKNGAGQFMARLCLGLAILAVLIVFIEPLNAWFSDLTKGAFDFFGWGLVLLAVTILIVVLIVNRQKVAAAFTYMGQKRVNIWLGLLFLIAGIWGILGLCGAGGVVGEFITGGNVAMGILITAILLMTAFLLFFLSSIVRSAHNKQKTKTEVDMQFGLAKPDFNASFGYKQDSNQNSSKYQPQVKYQDKLSSAKYVEKPREYYTQPSLNNPKSNYLGNKEQAQARHDEEMAKKGGMIAPSSFVAPEAKFKNKEIRDVQYDLGAKDKRSAMGDYAKNNTKESQKSKVLPVKALAFGVPSEKMPKQSAKDMLNRIGNNNKLAEQDGWKLPPLDLLEWAPPQEEDRERALQQAEAITDALASYGVEAKVVQINTGPTITQFGIEPGWIRKYKEVRERDQNGNINVRREEVSKMRIKVERIKSLQDDLAMALAVRNIRIEAPIPGKSLVGVELPNKYPSSVNLRDVMETESFEKVIIKSPLALALGKGVGGESTSADLAKMPHLLIAGATGSGKSVCLNSLVCCLLVNNTPADVRFIMIDPKRVEMTSFATLPHLATPIIVDAQKALGALRWLVLEMENRYELMSKQNSRNIEIYNKKINPKDKLPYIVLVIDELADLMMVSSDEVETILCRLAQKARATGIHLVVATQRPSVDVITGLIKANFPTRISFAVTSAVDSRTILDSIGAEKLLGHGDMFYLPQDSPSPKRLQGCYVSDSETERLVYFWSRQKTGGLQMLLHDDEIEKANQSVDKNGVVLSGGGGKSEDPLMESVRALAEEHGGQISTSFLQRRLSIGYPRAARLADLFRQEQQNQREDDLFDEDM